MRYYARKSWYYHIISPSRSTIIGIIAGIVLGASVFLVANPSIRSDLLADVAPSQAIVGYAGEIVYRIGSKHMTVFSNTTLEGVESVSFTIAHNPEKEVLISKPSNANIEKLGPTMTTYTIKVSTLKPGQSIAVFSHNGNQNDLSLADVEVLSDDMKTINPSVSLMD
ncbi:MAG TPA: hypothetical protein PLW93_05090 [Candidatus Absconditabacterales bacterium]|nr:hypothetical protein [Candidatus Absconditabacterales bacterium]HNG97618.1 hypothetical protein [Candidatus Absconditabacterales bacterium]